ncbi:MAG: leucine--tRNA ligase, partial [Chitinophagaceae bacterium]|nr:leucine--tRNA ligase [Chitinophagaceae bacterium]
MEYDFKRIEKEWQKKWREKNAYKVSNPEPGDQSPKPKYYVLDMFPYPSGTGLHVGHPLGYIASDIYSRYKRLKGFNVLHPMGFDSFGLPAEQYALDTGQHPAETTKKNIATFKAQLDNIGFCYDWDREVRTSDPNFYKWTQWIFLQLFDSFYNRNTNKAEPVADLIDAFETEGNGKYVIPNAQFSILNFSAKEWKGFDEKTKQDILMQYRLAYCGYGEVNWCEALGTVLANDEVVNGVSERGGYPVVKKKLRQWYLRITEYADRLLEGLDRIDFSEAMKEMQTNWIGKSSGAEIEFRLTPNPSPRGEGGKSSKSGNFFQTADITSWQILKEYGRMNRKNPTEAEDIIWQRIRNNQLGIKVSRQHGVQGYIVDFALMEVKLVIELDGGYHNEEDQKIYDKARTEYLKEFDLELIRFTNDEVINNTEEVINKIKAAIEQQKIKLKNNLTDGDPSPLLGEEKGSGDEAPTLRVYTTRPDTIFGVDFMVIAPEHELVEQITTVEQKKAVVDYITYVKSRSERERMSEKKISGVFTGAYALNPFNEREIPVWISEYVLAGYGTGAIMGVPCGDERDFRFAKHFGIPVTNIIGKHFNGEEANATKEAVLENSGFLDGLVMKEAMEVAIKAIEEKGIGIRKVNYKMRDAAFSRQRYWGEPFPIKWINGIAYPLDESELPLQLPHVDSYKPGPDGEGPLANLADWVQQKVKIDIPSASPEVSPFGENLEGALETNTMPGYAGSSWYFFRYMDPRNDKTFCDRKISDYWNQVDLYIGGTEHAVGHLLYSRLWTKVLYDLGHIGFDEPFKKLMNQGMIQGSSRFVYRIKMSIPFQENYDFLSANGLQIFVSNNIRLRFIQDENGFNFLEWIKNRFPELDYSFFNAQRYVTEFSQIHVDVNIVDGVELDIEAFRKWRDEYRTAEFILEDGKYICGSEVEKMSKSKFNTVNPDDLVAKYGADTFRMYEMFLG